MYEQVIRSKTSKVIENYIRSSIMKNKLRPGDKLASEKELADSFGVSRQTLREALSALESLGLVELRKGSSGGAYVGEVPFARPQKSLIDFLHTQNVSLTHDHLSEARMVIEPYAARMAACSMTAGQRDALIRLHEEATGKIGSVPRAELRPLEMAFHHRISECVTSPLVRFFSGVLVNLVDETNMKNTDTTQDFSRLVNASHAKILDAIVNSDPDAAEKAMYDDIVLTREIWGKLYREGNAAGENATATWVVYGDHVRED